MNYMYDDFSQFNFHKILKEKIKFSKLLKFKKNKDLQIIVIAIIALSILFGFIGGFFSILYFYQAKSYLDDISNILNPQVNGNIVGQYSPQTSQEDTTIKAVNSISPAVVSIVVSKDVAVFEKFFYDPFKEFQEFFGETPNVPKIEGYRQKGTVKKNVGGGTGVIVSDEGFILTNKHVVLDNEAEYIIYTNDARKFMARVLARDPIQDLAILKIEQEKTVDNDGQLVVKPFPVAKLGDSDKLQIGQTVITIGNALGEFRNTVSVGVISGLGRSITASGGDFVEILEDVIQTDAAINRGNSGGPLVNLKGEVVGINTAMASSAQSIGFSIPINKAKKAVEQVKKTGEIVYPFLGIRYILINNKVKEERDLPVAYGVLIVAGPEGEYAVWPDSAAEKAGLEQGDIVLEFADEKITPENTLAKIIMKYNPGDKVNLKYLRDGEETLIEVELGERAE